MNEPTFEFWLSRDEIEQILRMPGARRLRIVLQGALNDLEDAADKARELKAREALETVCHQEHDALDDWSRKTLEELAEFADDDNRAGEEQTDARQSMVRESGVSCDSPGFVVHQPNNGRSVAKHTSGG
jgi:hypothetical protein